MSRVPLWGRDSVRGGEIVVGPDRALTLLNDMLWNSLLVAGPILLAILVVGLLISVFQVTTQLQEMTLSYVPKILTAAVLLIAIGPWMLGRVTHFATSLYLTIPTLAG
jgi:flagellar biosynthesis protein FliQ